MTTPATHPGKHAGPYPDAPRTVSESTDAPSDVAPSEAAESRIEIVGGNPTATEIAAVTAVLAGVLEELSGHVEEDRGVAPSAWAQSQRPIRAQLHPGAGAWRSFSG